MHSSFDTYSPETYPQTVSADDSDISLNRALNTLLLGNFQDRWEVTKRLPTFGEKAIAPILSLLADDSLDWEVRWFAARTLGEFDRPEVIAALLSLFIDTEDEELRQSAADALTQIGPSAVAALTHSLRERDRKPIAAQALAQIRHRSTIPPLLELAQDESAPLRALALEALAGYPEPRVLPTVQAALDDPAGEVRLQAVRALGAYRQKVDPQTLMDWLEPRLQDSHLAVCRAAIALLGRLPLPAAAVRLIALIQAPTAPQFLRQAAIQALGWMGTRPAVEGLLKIWQGASMSERSAIVTALSHQSEPELRELAAQALLIWLQQLSLERSAAEKASAPAAELEPLRRQSALALGQMGAVAARATLEALQEDPDEGMRLHAIAALRHLD
ncbi:MAG: HEAT repeat domain-containing protein [Cyanobacteria bacterium Co-bin13]|nr:HEAT repeat domain-containing protein [Cyanobacteria bacterium Co-bin13]